MDAFLLRCGASVASHTVSAAARQVAASDGSATAIVERSDWLAAIHDGPNAVAVGGLLVVADGWLVARDALAEKLRAANTPVPVGDEAVDWVRAGFAALDPELFSLLEGEFAVLIWDAARRTLWAASDVTGRRAIYWAADGDRLVAASTASAVAQAIGTRAIDTQVLAERATLLVGSARRTAWRDVHRVGGGDLLRWTLGQGAPTVEAFQRYAPFVGGNRVSSDEAAHTLAKLMERAVVERMAPTGRSTVWMSGGYDSTSVFASGRMGLGKADPRTLEPVSISYPVGSTGREDELIIEAAGHWQAPIHWLTLGDSAELAAGFEALIQSMDDAFVHLYGYGMQALARRSHAAEAAVGLCGYGGDAVFYAAPDAYLIDLVGRGRVGEAWREFRAFGMGGRRAFLQRMILPNLPAALARPIARWAKVQMPVPLFSRTPMPWVRGPGVDAEALAAVARNGGVPRRAGESSDGWTIRFMLESPFFQKVQESLQHVARYEGVSHRSPMMDRRVVDFMAQRPRRDRAAAGETKRLLRQSMADRLPASLTGPRPTRTGVPSDVLERAGEYTIRSFAEGGGPDRMIELGVIDRAEFEAAQARYLQSTSGSGMLGLHLLASIATERWLRARM